MQDIRGTPTSPIAVNPYRIPSSAYPLTTARPAYHPPAQNSPIPQLTSLNSVSIATMQ